MANPPSSKTASYPTTADHLNRNSPNSPIDVSNDHPAIAEADLHPCQLLPLHWTRSLDYAASEYGVIRSRPTSFHSRIAADPDPRPSSGLPELENEFGDRTAARLGVDLSRRNGHVGFVSQAG